MNGQISIECAHCSRQGAFWINAWKKTTKAGARYLSLSLRPKRLNEHGQTGDAAAARDDDDFFN
jgi:hypothetical protein